MTENLEAYSKNKILIAEDDPTMRKLMELQLTNNGYEVTAVEDGRQALLLIQHKEFDLVISDIIMPFISGLELLNSIRKSKNSVAIIICSSLHSENAIKKAFEIGANDFITKPYHTHDLLERVAKILGDNQKHKVVPC